jgi:hypothetical protein
MTVFIKIEDIGSDIHTPETIMGAISAGMIVAPLIFSSEGFTGKKARPFTRSELPEDDTKIRIFSSDRRYSVSADQVKENEDFRQGIICFNPSNITNANLWTDNPKDDDLLYVRRNYKQLMRFNYREISSYMSNLRKTNPKAANDFFNKFVNSRINYIMLEFANTVPELQKETPHAKAKKQLIIDYYSKGENQSTIIDTMYAAWNVGSWSHIEYWYQNILGSHQQTGVTIVQGNQGIPKNSAKAAKTIEIKQVSVRDLLESNDLDSGVPTWHSSAVGAIKISWKRLFVITGFDDWLASQDETSFLTADEISNVGDLLDLEADAGAATNKTLISAGQSASGKATLDPTRLDKINLFQCALMTDLLHGGYSVTKYPASWAGKPFNGRIYPVTPDESVANPDILMSRYQTSPKSKKNFEVMGRGNQEMHWSLSWVYLDDDAVLAKEKEIFKSTKSFKQGRDIIAEELRKAEKSVEPVPEALGPTDYNMTGIVLTFEGADPSTARRDAQATLTIDLGNLRAITSLCSIIDNFLVDGKKTTKYLKLHELITAPTIESTESGRLPNATMLKSNIPDFSRIRLRVWAEAGSSDAITVDLTTIQHTIARKENSETGGATLTINYRGYIEQIMEQPFMDAQGGINLLNKRLDRDKKLKELIKLNCSDRVFAKAKKAVESINKNEAIIAMDNGELFQKIVAKGLIYQYKPTTDIESLGAFVDPSVNYVHSVTKLGDEYAASARRGDSDPKIKTKMKDRIATDYEGLEKHNDYFVFFGDFLNVINEILYKKDTADMADHAQQYPTRFIINPVKVPNPRYFSEKSGDPKPYIIINPVQIPITLSFLTRWYNQKYVKTRRVSTNIGVFIKELINNLLNDIMFEICFANQLAGGTPPTFTSTFLVDHDDEWLKVNSKTGWLEPIIQSDFNLFKSNVADDKKGDVSKAKHYWTFYQTFASNPNAVSAPKSNGGFRAVPKNDDSVVTLYYGSNFKDLNYCSNVKFTRTDIEYLEEARYMNSGLGSLNLLSNVYDLSFAFISQQGNTAFYPGTIINFILTDFSGANQFKIGETPLGQTDPHVKGTLANVLGFGGYYIVKKVVYDIKSKSPEDFTISIETKFMGTDADAERQNRSPRKKVHISEPAKCVAEVNELILRQNSLASEVEDENRQTQIYPGQEGDPNTPENASNSPDGEKINFYGHTERVTEVTETKEEQQGATKATGPTPSQYYQQTQATTILSGLEQEAKDIQGNDPPPTESFDLDTFVAKYGGGTPGAPVDKKTAAAQGEQEGEQEVIQAAEPAASQADTSNVTGYLDQLKREKPGRKSSFPEAVNSGKFKKFKLKERTESGSVWILYDAKGKTTELTIP